MLTVVAHSWLKTLAFSWLRVCGLWCPGAELPTTETQTTSHFTSHSAGHSSQIFFIHPLDRHGHDDIWRDRQYCLLAVCNKRVIDVRARTHTHLQTERVRLWFYSSFQPQNRLQNAAVKDKGTKPQRIPFSGCFTAVRVPKSNPKQASSLNSKQLHNHIHCCTVARLAS